MATLLVFALALGIVAGLRAMTAPAAASWAAHAGVLEVGGTWLEFMAAPYLPAALVEDVVAVGAAAALMAAFA